MYSHGLASIAICEAYAMTRDPDLVEPAQLALNFLVYAQDPRGGGWRYCSSATRRHVRCRLVLDGAQERCDGEFDGSANNFSQALRNSSTWCKPTTEPITATTNRVPPLVIQRPQSASCAACTWGGTKTSPAIKEGIAHD